MEGRLLSRVIIIVMLKLNILLEQLKKKNYSEKTITRFVRSTEAVQKFLHQLQTTVLKFLCQTCFL